MKILLVKSETKEKKKNVSSSKMVLPKTNKWIIPNASFTRYMAIKTYIYQRQCSNWNHPNKILSNPYRVYMTMNESNLHQSYFAVLSVYDVV